LPKVVDGQRQFHKSLANVILAEVLEPYKERLKFR